MPKFDASRWDKIPHSIEQGLDPLKEIVKKLELLRPDLQFAFFTEDDLPARRSEDRYEMVTTADWGEFRDEWNKRNPERFQLHDKDGALAPGEFFPDGSQLNTLTGLIEIKGSHLGWRQLFLCARSKKWGQEQQRTEQQASEDRYRAVMREQAQTMPKWDVKPDTVNYESEFEVTKQSPGRAEEADPGKVPDPPNQFFTNENVNPDVLASEPKKRGRPRKNPL